MKKIPALFIREERGNQKDQTGYTVMRRLKGLSPPQPWAPSLVEVERGGAGPNPLPATLQGRRS